MVLRRSTKMMKRMLKQQKPQSWFMGMSPTRLCTVELIQRRRCERNTFHESGAMVQALASKMYLVLQLEWYLNQQRESCRVTTQLRCQVATPRYSPRRIVPDSIQTTSPFSSPSNVT